MSASLNTVAQLFDLEEYYNQYVYQSFYETPRFAASQAEDSATSSTLTNLDRPFSNARQCTDDPFSRSKRG